MTQTEILQIAFVKIAADECAVVENKELTASMRERLKKITKENLPKGLPEGSVNVDETDPDYPTRTSMPPDKGWAGANLITGSGNGPELSSVR